MSNIIIKPIITEKATFDSEMNNRYAFIVDRKANKIEIKKAVESMYGVTVDAVRTMNYGGGKPKTKFTNKGVVEARVRAYKKAIIDVAEGEMIDFYSNI